MHALIVLAHPEPRSFNARMKDLAAETLTAEGWRVEVSDLYAQGFDPVEGPAHYAARRDPARFSVQSEQRHASETGGLAADVAAELDKLERAELVVLQFPMWWYGVPAILKGWIDRVFVYGGRYTGRMRYDAGYYKGRRALLSVTTGGPEPTFRHNGRNGDIDLLLWPLNFTLYYMGYGVLPPFVAFQVESGLRYSAGDDAARLAAWERAYAARLRELDRTEPLPFNGWEDWGDEGRLKPGVPGFSPFMRGEP